MSFEMGETDVIQHLKRIGKGHKVAKLFPELTQKEVKKTKPNKYKNKNCEIDGIKFKSLAEGRRYSELKILKKKGEIKDFGYETKTFVTVAKIKYTPDFEIENLDGTKEYEEIKGKWTEAARIRVKLFIHVYPEIKLTVIIKGVKQKFK